MGRAITFDTLAYAKKLIAAGVPEKQAEVQAETFAEIIDEQIATKRDLAELKSEVVVEIIKWVAGMMIVQTTAIIAAVAALIKLLG